MAGEVRRDQPSTCWSCPWWPLEPARVRRPSMMNTRTHGMVRNVSRHHLSTSLWRDHGDCRKGSALGGWGSVILCSWWAQLYSIECSMVRQNLCLQSRPTRATGEDCGAGRLGRSVPAYLSHKTNPEFTVRPRAASEGLRARKVPRRPLPPQGTTRTSASKG